MGGTPVPMFGGGRPFFKFGGPAGARGGAQPRRGPGKKNISRVSVLLNLLHEMTKALTFENVSRWPMKILKEKILFSDSTDFTV